MLPTEGLPLTLLGPVPLWIHWMTGHEELGRLFEYELELYSEAGELPFAALLGQTVTACLAREAHGPRFWNGVITRLARRRDQDGFLVLRAVLSPRLWLLTRTGDCRIYQGQTVPEVVKTVLQEHGIPFTDRLQPGIYRRWDYLTQYRESDFAFV